MDQISESQIAYKCGEVSSTDSEHHHKAVTAYDFACAMADRIYWLDDNYVQPFYAWAAPRLRDVAINGLFWGLIALIDVAVWLAATTRQFMARDAHAITLGTFTQVHEPLPEFLALAPVAVPLESPSMVGLLLPIASAPGLDLLVNDQYSSGASSLPC